MMHKIVTPHDRFFKSIMSDPKIVKDFLRKSLPTNIKTILNFDTIAPQKESFIDDKLRLQIADLLFTAEFNGRSGYLYLLLETQSTPDILMPFRLLKYTVAIMDQHLKKTRRFQLPVVYPMVLYSGRKNYNYSTDMFDLFGDDKKLALDILFKPFQLIDLAKITDMELQKHLMCGMAMRTMKHIYEKNFLPTLRKIVNDLGNIEKNIELDYIYKTLTYIVEAAEIADREEFVEILTAGLTTINEGSVMTLAEQWKQEGILKGRQETMTLAEQWKREGIQKGRQEAMTLAEQWKQEGILKGKQEAMTLAEQWKQEGILKGRQEALTLAEQWKQEGILKGKQEAMTLAEQWKQESKQEGIEKGKTEALRTVAMKLVNQHMPIDQIAFLTGLAAVEVEKLKNGSSNHI